MRAFLSKPAGRTHGIVAVALSGLGFGCLGVFGKAAFRAGLTPGENLALRFTLSAALMWAVLLVTDRRAARLAPRQLAACAGLGLGGYAVFSSFYFEALRGLSASLTVLLLYTYPLLVALGGWAALGERPGPRTLRTLPAVMVGLVLLVWGDFSVQSRAALGFGLGAAVLYSVYILASSRWLAGIKPLVSVTYIQTFAALGLAAVHLRDAARVESIVVTAWPIVVAIAVVSTALPMALFLRGLQLLAPTDVSMLSTVEPITGVILATLLLGETLRAEQVVGGVLILGALLYMAREPQPIPEPPSP